MGSECEGMGGGLMVGGWGWGLMVGGGGQLSSTMSRRDSVKASFLRSVIALKQLFSLSIVAVGVSIINLTSLRCVTGDGTYRPKTLPFVRIKR